MNRVYNLVVDESWNKDIPEEVEKYLSRSDHYKPGEVSSSGVTIGHRWSHFFKFDTILELQQVMPSIIELAGTVGTVEIWSQRYENTEDLRND